MPNIGQLQELRAYFDSGITKPAAFRKQQLKQLKESILRHEEDLYHALYADLKKSKEESWVTETGLVLNEIRIAIKNLDRWMRPERTSTNLLNFPSASRIEKEPLGVVLIVGPWNYPLQLLFLPLVGAIAAGNTIVLKPSEFCPSVSAVMKKITENVFDPRYILYVEGDGAEVVPAMLQQFSFDHIFYTGSTQVGRIIYKMAAEHLTPVTLELGGKSPCVVESDANIKVSAKRIVMTKFSNAGQMCVAPDYLLVHESVKLKLTEALSSAILNFYGDQPAGNYNYGKIINEKQFDRLFSYLKNMKILQGGKSDRDSLYIEPTLLDEPSIESAVMNDEIFGPLLPIVSFKSMDEAVGIIRRHPNPLSFYIYTRSHKKEKAWLDAVPSGGACVNNSSWHLTNHHLPFGGRGFSGMGKYHGKFSFETFSHQKAVMRTPTWFDPSIRYPPLKGKLGLFKKIIR
jgi:aldehyde dehydrogenase (NAD+)